MVSFTSTENPFSDHKITNYTDMATNYHWLLLIHTWMVFVFLIKNLKRNLGPILVNNLPTISI